ncbi:MAG TPA: aspartate aminotransferase family protein [Candidatus Nanopelagicales bacterium]|nr:aspartate aminotransferase family protein [Candidatus Nanopelagicales bacterium]
MTATHTTDSPLIDPNPAHPPVGHDPAALQRDLRAHMLFNFTDMSRFETDEMPVFVRGEGCYVEDVHGRRFIDGLSGLFCTNLGHSYGEEVAQAAVAQMRELVYTPTWTVAHPAAIALATRIASKAPDGMEHVFFTNSGSEANESAWKIARQWHAANGDPGRRKAIARRYAYHGTTMGALSFTGYAFARAPFEPLAVPTHHVAHTGRYRHPFGDDEAAFCQWLLDDLEQALEFEGPETIAMLIAEPVQNSGGSYMPPAGYWQGLREICDKYGILLVADEVITGYGRVGEWFGSLRFDAQPDMITFAKGVTAGHAPLGGVILRDRVAEPFTSGRAMFTHGNTWSGHPLSTAIGLTVLDIIERDGVIENVRANEPQIAALLEPMRDLPFVGDVRGCGHFWALEVVKDKATAAAFSQDEANWILKDALSGQMQSSGLLCRLDDRDQPVIQLSPPLIADMDTIGTMLGIVTDALLHVDGQVRRGEAPWT